MKRSIVRSAVLAVTAFVCLHGVSASAQRGKPQQVESLVILHCNQSIRFSPGLQGYFDLAVLPTTGNPSVADGAGGRVGGGTAGEIEINGHSRGDTTITYGLKDFNGNPVIVKVFVVVYCPDPPRNEPPDRVLRPPIIIRRPLPDPRRPEPPPLPHPVFPVPPPTPTHRVARCAACADTANQLNSASDQLSEAVDELLRHEGRLRESLQKLSTDSYISVLIVNQEQKNVDEDQANIEKLQAQIRALVEKLDACEKLCNVDSSRSLNPASPTGQTTPNGTPNNSQPVRSEAPNTPSRTQGNPTLKSMTIGIVLPQDVPAGQMVSGTVVTNPEQYKNTPGLQVIETTVPAPTSGSLEGLVVDTGDGKQQRADKPILMAIPIGGAAAGILVSVLDHPELPPTAATVPVNPVTTRVTQIPPTNYTTPGTPQNCVQEIHGPVSGNSNLTTATLDGKPTAVVAAKPGAVFVDTSNATTAGAHQIALHPSGQAPVTLTTHVVHASATVDNTVLHNRQSTDMTLIVDAGKISPSDGGTVSVKLLNETPGVIKIVGKQELIFNSKELAKGPVTTKIKLQAVGDGPFGVGWTMTPTFKSTTVPAQPVAQNALALN
jgi:hypothetical protein